MSQSSLPIAPNSNCRSEICLQVLNLVVLFAVFPCNPRVPRHPFANLQIEPNYCTSTLSHFSKITWNWGGTDDRLDGVDVAAEGRMLKSKCSG